MKQISMNLNFSGAILPVVDSEDGFQRVPLKPICEAVGVEWARQHKKMQTPYLARRLGICVEQMYYAGQTRLMVLIRLDRVESFLNTLNPELIRSAGNVDAADFLEAKHLEWDDLLHLYELGKGDLFKERSSRITTVRAFVSALKVKNATPDPVDRKAVSAILSGLARDLDIPYQQELAGTE
jgi:hypothetical protein